MCIQDHASFLVKNLELTSFNDCYTKGKQGTYILTKD